MASEFFISPTTSYTCKNKAVITLNGPGTELEATITFPDTSTETVTVAPGGKITLNSGENIEIVTAGATISGIEVLESENEVVDVISGNMPYAEYVISPLSLAVIYDGDGLPYPSGSGNPEPASQVLTSDEWELYWVSKNTLVSSLTTTTITPTCSSVNSYGSGGIIMGTDVGRVFGVSINIDNNIIFEDVYGDFIDQNISNGPRPITAVDEFGRLASFGQLDSDFSALDVDILQSYPHLFIFDDAKFRPLMVYLPYDFAYEKSIPIVLNSSGNIDVDYYLTTDTCPVTGVRIPKQQFVKEIIPAAEGFAVQVIPKDGAILFDEFTKNNPIVGFIPPGSGLNADENAYVLKDGTVLTVVYDEIPGYGGIATSIQTEILPSFFPHYSSNFPNQSFPTFVSSYQSPTYTCFAYYDWIKSKTFFSNQPFLSDIFFQGITTYAGYRVPSTDYIRYMPLQSIFDKQNRIYDPSVTNSLELYDLDSRYFARGEEDEEDPRFFYSYNVPTLGGTITGYEISRHTAVYIADPTKPLNYTFPHGFVECIGCQYIKLTDSLTTPASFLNDPINFMFGNGTDRAYYSSCSSGPYPSKGWWIEIPQMGRGGRSKIHCIGKGEDGLSLIIINDGGLCATMTIVFGTETRPALGGGSETVDVYKPSWNIEDISSLTEGRSVRAISGKYAVGDKGLILKKNQNGWRKVDLNPLPPNAKGIDFTMVQMADDGTYFIGAKDYIAAIPN